MQRPLRPAKQKRFQERIRPAALETIPSSKHPEIIHQPARPRGFLLRPPRLAPRHRPRATWCHQRHLTLRAAVAAIAAAASLPATGVAPRAGPQLLPHLRRTPRLLLPAVAAGARTEALASHRESENGSAFRSRFSLAASRVLEPHVRRDLQNTRVVCADGLTERAGSAGGTNVLGIDAQILGWQACGDGKRKSGSPGENWIQTPAFTNRCGP
jgi:hypothetical protein